MDDRAKTHLYRIALYGGALLLGIVVLTIPRSAWPLALSLFIFYVAFAAAWRANTDPSVRRIGSEARVIGLCLLLALLVVIGLFVARSRALPMIVYVPIALLVWRIVDARVLQRLYPVHRSRDEVARMLRSFADGSATRSDWHNFTANRIDDPQLEAIRVRLRLTARRSGDRDRVIRECLEEIARTSA